MIVHPVVSPGDLRARIEQLAKKWRDQAQWEVEDGDPRQSATWDQCADELLALLGAAQEQP